MPLMPRFACHEYSYSYLFSRTISFCHISRLVSYILSIFFAFRTNFAQTRWIKARCSITQVFFTPLSPIHSKRGSSTICPILFSTNPLTSFTRLRPSSYFNDLTTPMFGMS
ncbi:hypothetical protein L218DRAFT_731354 [Marasmius fiardii PR-910]|nr:hypothetical protein L218DRAFT_731354 [Marasmius fiardii PR-910]